MDEWDEIDEWDEDDAEAVGDAAAGAEGENNADADINAALDVAAADREARDNGEKPADEWTRRDFRNYLQHHPTLKELTTSELFALFLRPTRTIGGRLYCSRLTVREARKRRGNGEKPLYELGITPAVSWAAGHAYPGASQWLEEEKRKIDVIWQNL